MESLKITDKERYKTMTLDNFETELISKKAKRLDLVINQTIITANIRSFI